MSEAPNIFLIWRGCIMHFANAARSIGWKNNIFQSGRTSLNDYLIIFLNKTSLFLHARSRKTCTIMKTFEIPAPASGPTTSKRVEKFVLRNRQKRCCKRRPGRANLCYTDRKICNSMKNRFSLSLLCSWEKTFSTQKRNCIPPKCKISSDHLTQR